MAKNYPDEDSRFVTDTFIKIVECHAPLKKRFVRGNETSFVNKGPRKAIYTKSKLRNNFCKNPTKENQKKCKIQLNKFVAFRKKSIKKYFKNISEESVVTKKNVWSMIKSFLTKKSDIKGEEII